MWRTLLVLAAVAAALLPVDPARVEKWYSTGLYPRVQAHVTPLTNRIPVALLDLAVATCILVGAVLFVRSIGMVGWRRAVARGALSLMTGTAVIYLVFLIMWGLNYRRVPLERKLDYDRSRITRPAAVALANKAAAAMNGGFTAAHATAWDSRTLEASFDRVLRRLGATTQCGTRNSQAVAADAVLPSRRDRRNDRSLLSRDHREHRRARHREALRPCARMGAPGRVRG